MRNLSIDTLTRILSNDKLQLNTEDQLLKFVNKCYKSDSKYSILYETVLFEIVSSEVIKEFTLIFDNEDMNHETWLHLIKRLQIEVQIEKESSQSKRYRQNQANLQAEKKQGIEFSPPGQNTFKGILNYLRTQSNNQIESKVSFSTSSIGNSDEYYQPRVVTLFEDENKYFYTNDEPGSWLCFDFGESRVIPTDYTMKSYNCSTPHPKSWVIECSNDNSSWETVDEENNCSYLNGANIVHTFKMNHPSSKEFRYIRIRQTGTTWSGNNHLVIDSFEIYGKLI